MSLRGFFNSELGAPAAMVLVVRLIGAAAGFTLTVAVARALGAAGSGLYWLAMSVVSIAEIVGKLGVQDAALRFVSTAAAEGDWSRVAAIYRYALALVGGASAALAAAIAVFAPLIADSVFSDSNLIPVLRVAALLVPVQALMKLHSSLLKAIHRPVIATTLQFVGPPGAAALLIWVFGFTTPSTTVAVVTGSVAGSLLTAVFFWLRDTGLGHLARGTFDLKLLLRTSMPLLLVASLGQVIQWTDVIMIGIFSTSEEVGVYTPTLRMAAMLSLVLVALNSVVPPRFAVLYERGDMKGLESMARETSKLGLSVGLPALIVTMGTAPWLLSILGPEFIRAEWALRIVVLGEFVRVAAGSVAYLLVMTGHQRFLQRTMVGAAIANVALNAILIPIWGIIGAAIATSAGVIGVNVANLVWARTKLRVQPLPGLRRVHPAKQ